MARQGNIRGQIRRRAAVVVEIKINKSSDPSEGRASFLEVTLHAVKIMTG